MTFRQLSQCKVTRTRFSDWMQKMVGQKQARQDYGKLHVQGQTAQLPARPNSTVLNHSIPLFFIGRNRDGFWVAREAAGRCGDLFLFRRSAARFARKKGARAGSLNRAPVASSCAVAPAKLFTQASCSARNEARRIPATTSIRPRTKAWKSTFYQTLGINR